MLDFNDLCAKLPISNASFADLRASGKVCVDKTDFVYQIVRNKKPKILTRPRRFGKSTLLSTIKELFLHGTAPYDGHDSYFKGLKIEKLWQDKGKYHVLSFDFDDLSRGCPKVKDFKEALIKELNRHARVLGITYPEDCQKISEKLTLLVQSQPDNSLVLLIDEYDAPLLAHLHDAAEKQAAIDILKGICSTVKTLPEKFRCVFATGIISCRNLDLGTAGNTLREVSLSPDYSTACGFTRDELKEYFHDNLASVTYQIPIEEVSAEHIEKLLNQMAAWYDGFCFDDMAQARVFSTWSVLRFFGDRYARFLPYWAQEITPGMTLLLKAVITEHDIAKAVTDVKQGFIRLNPEAFRESSLVSSSCNPCAILYQTGCLTLTDSITSLGYVHLGFPNQEILEAYSNLLA